MSEIEYVVPPAIKVSQDAVFNFADLYNLTKSWFEKHKYDFFEKEYLDTERENKKSCNIRWMSERKVDDYTKFHIDIAITGYDLEDVSLKTCVACKGRIVFQFASYLERDYEDMWSHNFFMRFIRSAYDTFVIRGKFSKYKQELKEETYALFNQTKSFLRLQEYKA
ncbi:hypothetical protein J4430_00555 [Candidatus Woesearchaeota archaeon]|nr:hypothetical protein [Candidatus Woesearchaeota archaeon]